MQARYVCSRTCNQTHGTGLSLLSLRNQGFSVLSPSLNTNSSNTAKSTSINLSPESRETLIPGVDFKLVYDRPNPIPGDYPPTKEYLDSIGDYTLPASHPGSRLHQFRHILSQGSTQKFHDSRRGSLGTDMEKNKSILPVEESHSRPLRVAHITDLHFLDQSPIAWQQLLGKRGLGYINLYYRGRAKEFSDAARAAVIQKVIDEKPDLVIISGDLTSTARESEFIMAREGLQKILFSFPTLVIPGNHDYYSQDAVRSNFMVRYFGPWMNLTVAEYDGISLYQPPPGVLEKLKKLRAIREESLTTGAPSTETEGASRLGISLHSQSVPVDIDVQSESETDIDRTRLHPPFESLPCLTLDDIVVLGLDPTEPRIVRSNGSYKSVELEDLWTFLNPVVPIHGLDPRGRCLPTPTYPELASPYHNPLLEKFIILATHYPVLDRSGVDYQTKHKLHGVLNNDQLVRILDKSQVKPNLVIHGHDHLGFTVPFFARPNATFGSAFSEKLVKEKDNRDREAILRDMEQHPMITLEEFKKYGRLGKKGRLLEFDRNRFPISSASRYLEKNLAYKKLQFSVPRKRTFENRGLLRSFSEYSVPFTICNPGSSGLRHANPKNAKDWPRRASLLVYNIEKRNKELSVSGVSGTSGTSGSVSSKSNVVAEAYTQNVNRKTFIYEGKSNFDLALQRFEVNERNQVVQVPASPYFTHANYDYADVLKNSRTCPEPPEMFFSPKYKGLTAQFFKLFQWVQLHAPGPMSRFMERLAASLTQLRVFL